MDTNLIFLIIIFQVYIKFMLIVKINKNVKKYALNFILDFWTISLNNVKNKNVKQNKNHKNNQHKLVAIMNKILIRPKSFSKQKIIANNNYIKLYNFVM